MLPHCAVDPPSHDRAFADKSADHLFVFEGDGVIKDFPGTLSEYASILVDLENDSIQQQGDLQGGPEKKSNYKEDKVKRNEQRNAVRRAKKDMANIENAIEKLKTQAKQVQNEIDQISGKGWTVLAELTEQLNRLNVEVEMKELRWLELAEEVEENDLET